MTTATFVPGAQQAQALAMIDAWYRDDTAEQVFRLFGYAGVGKTTLARYAVERLGISNVCFAAYTGKAAHVMRTRGGCLGAQTIHSLIYQPAGQDDTELRRLQGQLDELPMLGLDAQSFEDQRADLLDQMVVERSRRRDLKFVLRDDSELCDADLLVLDECSMVNEEMARHLLSFGVKILVLGDPAQLPPVSGAGYFTNHTPDCLLTEVHRTALDSPVCQIATSIRNSPPGDVSVGVGGSVGNSGRFRGTSNLCAYDQVICGTNKTRWQLISRIREARGLYGPKPVPGDRIMILANSRDAGVYNGQQYHVLSCALDPNSKGEKYQMVVQDDEGRERELRTWAEGFVNFDGEKSVAQNGRGLTVAATFAQAITTHKSQGSEWAKVLVIDESNVFRTMKAKSLTGRAPADEVAQAAHFEARRWLYTAVTRASERVSIIYRSAL